MCGLYSKEYNKGSKLLHTSHIHYIQLTKQHIAPLDATSAGGRLSSVLFVAGLVPGSGDGFAPAGLIETFTGVG